MADAESPEFRRYWIEFEIPPEERPKPPEPGRFTLDGESRMYRFLSRGVGVTGYDLDDCLGIIEGVLGQELAAVKVVLTDPDMSGLEWDSRLAYSGSPVWRSIWFPLLRDRPRPL